MRRLAPLFIIAVPALLACGGVWTEASKQAVGQTCRELPERLQGVPEGPHKARLGELLEQCAVAGDAGQIGIISVARFSAEVQTAAEDDKISDAEMLSLENAFEEMMRSKP